MPGNGSRPGPRPHLWRSGPDPEQHRRYLIWLQQRNQAQWRGEIWHLSFEEWLKAWGDRFDQRGRSSTSLCLTRRDATLPWSAGNVHVITRRQHGQGPKTPRRRPSPE